MAFLAEHAYIFSITGAFFAYSCWIAVKRLFLHPLADIPGPLLARLTSWHECYYDWWLGGKHPWALKAMHEKYGPIVRPVPEDVHIDDPDYLETIYAIRNRNSPFSGGLLIDQSIGATEDFAHHKMRRDALSPYFSHKAVLSLERVLTAKRDKLVAIFEEALESKQPLNISDAVFAYSNDVVRAFSFGSDNALLDSLSEAKVQRQNLAKLLTGVALNKHFPWIARGLANILPMFLGQKAIPPAAMEMINFRAKAGKDIEAVFADRTIDHKSGNSIFYELRDSVVLLPEEKTMRRLQDEATLLIMAGTESPAKSMSIAAFYVLSHPDVLAKLRKELSKSYGESAKDKASLNTLMVLPYLNAIIHEANRLSFGVTKRLDRYSPNETLTYTATTGPYKGKSYILPPRTRMSCATFLTHTNETLFPDPWKFDPERWLTEAESERGGKSEEVNKRKRSQMAMGKGHRICLGRNLANAELCLMIAALAEYDMKLFETDESDVKFQHDYQISHPRLDSLGVRAVVERRRTL